MKLTFLTSVSYREKAGATGILPNEPALPIQVRGPANPWDTQLLVDTGAERTVLSGTFAEFLGLDLSTGEPLKLQSATGSFRA